MKEAAVYPSPIAAVLLAALAWLVVQLTAAALASLIPLVAALGLAAVIGYGAVGGVAALGVPPPHAERVGLRGLSRDVVLPLVLLVPTMLLTSELNNVARALVPPPEAAALAAGAGREAALDSATGFVQMLVVVAGLEPIVEEWFFRGILQQGIVARLGPVWGVLLTAALYGLVHGVLGLSTAGWLAVGSAAFGTGIVLGIARVATGSVLAPIALEAGMSALGVVALAFPHDLAIPGFNAPGPHTPALWLAPAAVSVALGTVLLLRRRAVERASEPAPDEDREPAEH